MSKSFSDESSLESVRAILLAREQERLERLEQRLKELQEQAGLSDKQIRASLEELHRQHADTEALINRIAPAMTGMVRRAIRESGGEMAETLGPIMGEAIRVQIRDSRDEMVDTLYPIIGSTIQKALGQFTRELQRNIDARLRSTFGPEGMLRRLWARLRGVSASELALRDALPFDIKEIFLIQRASGILIARSRHSDLQADDSDLIGGMLTAIRSFVNDAFQGNDELDEIQFGEDRIVIQNGAHAYLAAVISGIEPEGFRAALTELVSNLHLRHNSALRDFDGHPESLPNFQPQLAQWIAEQTGREEKRPLTQKQKIGYAIAALLAILLVALACFYLVFTIRLLPLAFPAPTPTATLTWTPTPTITPSPSPTATLTLTPTPTVTPSPSPTATFTPSPSATSLSTLEGVLTGTVWVRAQPDAGSERIGWLTEGNRVNVLAAYGDWLLVSWRDAEGEHRGWATAVWISVSRPLPAEIVTPLP